MSRWAAGDAGKKLRAAAVAWVTGGRGGIADPDDPHADAINAHLARRQGKESTAAQLIEVAPDEEEAVALFMALDTQWRFHPLAGVRTGLDYAALTPTASMLCLEMSARLFGDIRIMEGAAMRALAK